MKRQEFVAGKPFIRTCPFCGATAHQTSNIVKDPRSTRFWITCNVRECHAVGPVRKTARGAIAAWNTRGLV